MSDGLPPEVIEALQQKEKAQMKHNWMYSFMPSHEQIYLVGYCKVCDQTVSSWVPLQDRLAQFTGARVNVAGIPKWGCVPTE